MTQKVPEMIQLSAPELLTLRGENGAVFLGGSQTWYALPWRRMSGCGPTNASNLIWYLARSRPGLRPLWEAGDGGTDRFLELMNCMFDYVKPGMRGVNSTALFVDGALRFAQMKGLQLDAQVLEIPREAGERPSFGQVRAFVCGALEKDRPVAFLNLSNGAVRNLDNWHWVLLAAAQPRGGHVTMWDQGYKSEIDLELWLQTTTNGGGFVTLEESGGNAK